MKKTFTNHLFTNSKRLLFRSKGLFYAALLLCGFAMNAQVTVLVPASGSNSIPCGQTSLLQDEGGSGNYQNNDNGYTVINAGFASQITIAGTCAVEVSFDYIRIYNGVGTGGTLLQTYNANPGTINYTGTPGQTLTVQFTSDGSVVYAGFDLNITFSGPCSNIPCNSTPGINSINAPTFAICPNATAGLSLANNYTVGGITYAWQSSTVSPIGPWTPISTATANAFAATNQTISTYYSTVITCTNTSGSFTTAAAQVTVQPVITNTVPYYESFNGLSAANKLPNCSWAASNLPTTCQTYTSSNTLGRIPRTGTGFASFFYSPAGNNYFYTNGIYLNAGITYSAALWYETEYYGYNNWTDLSILYGTTQSTTGLVSIASSNGPAVSNVYKPLSNTFTVATSGLYYIAVRGTAASGSAQYLTWDDLSITIPCTSNSPNTPSVSLVASSNTICAGESVNLTASGADTFTWNAGSNASSFSDSPSTTTSYSVVGTNTLTGCMSSMSQMVVVNPVPVIYVVSDYQSVCAGSPAHLQAIGATSYTWSNGANSPNITVNPTAATSYTVLASSVNGCVGTAVQMINTYQLPTVTASTNRPNEMCPSEAAILTAAGTAVSYQWVSNVSALLLSGSPVNVYPTATTIYTVTGTDANGCQKSSTVIQNVVNCTGVGEQTALSGLHVYPNPTSGELSIASNNTLNKTIEVMDITGKVISLSTSNLEVVKLNIKDLSNGIYYVRIQSNNTVEVIKVVKE